jgi:hypothetical protein
VIIDEAGMYNYIHRAVEPGISPAFFSAAVRSLFGFDLITVGLSFYASNPLSMGFLTGESRVMWIPHLMSSQALVSMTPRAKPKPSTIANDTGMTTISKPSELLQTQQPKRTRQSPR